MPASFHVRQIFSHAALFILLSSEKNAVDKNHFQQYIT